MSLPKFGQYITGQGGYFAAIMRGHNSQTPHYALLVSDVNVGEIAKCAWGEYGKDVPGASSRTDGRANTKAMAIVYCPAALAVRSMIIGGHSDYFLPALGELNSAAANVPEQFAKEGWYWSSTQFSRSYAFAHGFEYGGSEWRHKYNENRVRAFRAIPLELLK
jgi:hypothetical protein